MRENIQFLGTGSGFSSLPNTNLLLNFKNSRIIIDFGFTGLKQLKELNLRPDSIDALIITHMHSDHIGGIEMLAYITKFKYRTKITLVLPHFEFKFMLWDTLRSSMQYSIKGPMKMADYFDTIVAKKDGCSQSVFFKSHRFIFVKTRHIPGMLSYGVVFTMNGKRIFYTSDTVFDPITLLKVNKKYNPSLIIHDTKTDNEEENVHATYKQLSSLPPQIKSKMLLIHYDDNYMEFSPEKDGFIGFAQTGEKYTP